jgi:GR25 family glycosyltransferase involved in LPS biosynthesis
MSIEYFVIHCEAHSERASNISAIQDKLGKPIRVFLGIDSRDVSLDDQEDYMSLFDENIEFRDFRLYWPGQIGCYLSHLMLVRQICDGPKADYAVIFEDDVDFDQGLDGKARDIVATLAALRIDFDLVFLGSLNDAHGEHIQDDLFFLDVDKPCWGAHALLVKTQNIRRVYAAAVQVRAELDISYQLASKEGTLRCLVVSDSICWQKQGDLKSTIVC